MLIKNILPNIRLLFFCFLTIYPFFKAISQYSDNSVLANGDWFKLGVPASGVYKLDYAALQSLGVNLSNLQIENIAIYGHRGGMLPEMVGSPRTDDLRKLPIKVVASSASFGINDYILFYAEGPDLIRYNSSTNQYGHSKNLYTGVKGYFLTTSESDPLYVSNAVLPVSTPGITLDEFDDIRLIDDNNISIGRSGRLWVRDEFDFTNERNYNFSFPNIVTTKPVDLTFKLASYADITTNRFRVLWNNNLVHTASFPKTPVNSGITDFARINKTTISLTGSGRDNTMRLSFEKAASRDKGWLDFILAVAKSSLLFDGRDFTFRNKASVSHSIIRYNISSTSSNEQIWDVTDIFNVKNIPFSKNGNQITFLYEGNSIKEFIVFSDVVSKPQLLGKVKNQNLHALLTPDYLIVCRESLLAEAEALAQFHRNQNKFSVLVTTYEDIINEFASGNSDMTAIRDFAKMLYDRGFEQGTILKYLLLFGDGSYNNRELGFFNLPTYQSDSGHLALFTYVSDDYYGMMDSVEGKNLDNTFLNKLDIAVGRIPADNKQNAAIAISKIEDYYHIESYRDWINQITLVSDDEDNNIHFRDAEGYASILENNPNFNLNKLHLDAFNQVSSSSGATYPVVNESINNQIIRGTHILNYVGHGGPNGLAEEKVITLADINSWQNSYRYPILITATCEFAPYDKPEISSAGERVLFLENGGAIALLTTVRLVFSNRNEIINRNFYNTMLDSYDQPDICLGDLVKEAKRRSNTGTGNLKFALLGDPALKMRFPKYKIVTTSINGKDYLTEVDTAKALSLMTIEGQITDKSDNFSSDFNGIVYMKLYDKKEEKTTLANDVGSFEAKFNSQTNMLFTGKAEVKNGKFEFQFVVPKDINYNIGEGKISYYAHNNSEEAAGSDIILVGGSVPTLPDDNDGPVIDVYLGDTTFISGTMTGNSPMMIVKLFDENGINASGIGIGRDITATINNNRGNAIVLNEFYETGLNSYQTGRIEYPLTNLAPGHYTLTVRAWDVMNNPGESTVEFYVLENGSLIIDNVLNYPNPFTDFTNFTFQHNSINEELNIKIEIYTYLGQLVKTIEENRTATSFRETNITWDGLSDGGYVVQKGIYIYKMTVSDNKGGKSSVSKKLVVLR